MGFFFNSKNRDSAPVRQYEIAAPKYFIAFGGYQNPLMDQALGARMFSGYSYERFSSTSPEHQKDVQTKASCGDNSHRAA